MKTFLILIFMMISFHFSFAQNEIWQTAVYATDEWRFISGTADIPNNWREMNFDDSTWDIGEGGIGYGDDDDTTIIPPVFSLYMRKSFALSDKSKILECLLSADFDDAFVAYLNGVEIARSNIAGEFPAWNVDASDYREARIYTGGTPVDHFVDAEMLENILQNGENVLSIQTHNRDGLTSSDLTALYWLSFFVSSPLPELGDFYNEEFLSGLESSLPIVRIDTDGNPIFDEPKIDGEIAIVWNEDGSPNDFFASANEYEGKIRIEKKGQSSLQLFPKNSYLFETVDDDGNDIDTSFLNFPPEEDFILHGPYSDKTLMRNVLVFQLANQIGEYASRTRFVELQVNGVYEGIYIMMERIKRDKNRVDIAKLREVDVEGDELTGGYIFKIDKGVPDWYSQYDIQNNPGAKLHFQYVYPRRDQIRPEQREYIKSYVDSFERVMWAPATNLDGKRFDDFIDIESFVDHFLLVELAKDVDAYRFSSYFHKDKDSNGGKLKCGPLWDFNLSFGNADYCQGWAAQGWMYYLHCDNGNPFWWNKLFTQAEFFNHAKCRWDELRQSVFHQDNIYQMIDENRTLISASLDRNYDRWPVLGQYVWPNFFVPADYNGEISVLKQFIGDRLEWMDQNMFGICDSTFVLTPTDNVSFKLSPNPVSEVLNIEFEYKIEGDFNFIIYDQLGRVAPNVVQINSERKIELDIAHLPKGIYFLRFNNGEDKGEAMKFIKIN